MSHSIWLADIAPAVASEFNVVDVLVDENKFRKPLGILLQQIKAFLFVFFISVDHFLEPNSGR